MKYKFDIWWKDPKHSKVPKYLDEIEVEAPSYKDALDIIAQTATDRTEITPCER